MVRRVAFLTVAFCLIAAAPSAAATFTVSTAADSGPGSLRAAVQTAVAGDTVVILASVPKITLTSGAITVTQTAPGLTIQGAGASATTVSGGNLFRIFVLNPGASLALSHLTVTGGGPGSNLNGGAIYGSGAATVTITDSAFTNNQTGPSSGDGGAIYLNGASSAVTITNSTFSGNSTSGGDGGAILLNGASSAVTITNSTFSANSTSGGDGGAILMTGSTLTITDSTFSANGTSGGDGGALHLTSSTLTITDSIFSGNDDGSVDGDGGALNVGGASTVTVTGSTFSGNHAGSVSGWGGAMSLDTTALRLTNSTIAGNVAGSSTGNGGGIVMLSGTATILNATITGNQATTGGGVNLVSGSAGFANTILADNTAPNGANCWGTATDQGTNDENGTSCGFTAAGDLNAEPALGPLQNNGGPTLTELPLSGSPVIDAGTNSGCPSTDQRGLPRPGGARCDIGAVEVQPPAVQPPPVVHRPKCSLVLRSTKIALTKPKKGRRSAPTPGTVRVRATCNQAVRATVTGTLIELLGKKPKHGKQRTRSFKLGPVKASLKAGAAGLLTVTLPRRALTALKAHAVETVAFTLKATNANGTATSHTKSSRLRAAGLH